MSRGYRMLGLALAAWLAMPWSAHAQTQGELWRAFAEKVPVGTELTVRLRNGQRFRATLIATRGTDLMLQPKTRVPVPVQPVPFDEILQLELRDGKPGVGKAAGIGVAAGAGAFLAILLAFLAAAG